MFTGIVQAVGRVSRLTPGKARCARLAVGVRFADGIPEAGESIAVDGACLTVVRATARGFEADLSAETLARTTAGSWKAGRRVNLERALRAGDRLGGHIVQGHVDGRGTVRAAAKGSAATTLRIEPAPGLVPLIAEKGSIAVDGVSLTVSATGKGWFEAALIPYTLSATNLGDCRPGDAVNLEADLIARYLAQLLQSREGTDAPKRPAR